MATRIVRVEYRLGQAFNVYLDGSTVPVVAADTFNQLAIDAAFERRTAVLLELDGDRIHRVQSDVAPGATSPTPSVPGDVSITRISTQVNGMTGDLIAEIFYDANRPVAGEQQARTTDQTIHLLCHGAYVANHQVRLELDGHDIIGVVKHLAPAV